VTARSGFLLALLSVACGSLFGFADDEAKPDAKPSVTLTQKWKVLVSPAKATPGTRPLPAKSPLQNLDDFAFTGPEPGHPFVIGDFVDDGEFGIVDGGVQKISGQNAVLQLPAADQFELEGIIEQVEFGGWFLMLGWDQDRGYLVSHVTMKESGSPWFLTELRGGAAVPDGHQEILHHEWNRSQPLKVLVDKNELTLQVGSKKILNRQPHENYSPGRVLIGVYDTRYGPKKLRIHSLRMRAVKPKNVEAADDEGEDPAEPADR
jgi:hypothetical protein